MSVFCCPVCNAPLLSEQTGLVCQNGHRFDRARTGYVNLLRSQQAHTKRHGDDKRMLRARRDFLQKGHYAPLREQLRDTLARLCTDGDTLLDAGCGEGYYTAYLADALPSVRVCGIDISKDALSMMRTDRVETAVASVFSLPLAKSSADEIVSVFAPCAEAEFARILKRGGHLVRAVPTARHLYGLKAAVYPVPRENPPTKETLDGFTLIARDVLSFSLCLKDKEDIRALFEMTPYYYKTGAADQQRLLSLDTLETEIGFAVLTYQRI